MRWIVLFAFWTTALSNIWTTGSWSLLAAQAQEQAWESYSMAVADLGDGPGGPGPPPYFSTKMRPKGSKKIWGGDRTPPPTPYLKVRIRHCYGIYGLNTGIIACTLIKTSSLPVPLFSVVLMLLHLWSFLNSLVSTSSCKEQTRICTTWPSFLFTCHLLFIISTHKLVDSRNFLSIRIVLSCFYLLIFYFKKFSTWIWPSLFAVYVKLELFIVGSFCVRFARSLGKDSFCLKHCLMYCFNFVVIILICQFSHCLSCFQGATLAAGLIITVFSFGLVYLINKKASVLFTPNSPLDADVDSWISDYVLILITVSL